MNAVIYLRVSTEEQADSGLGLTAQCHACAKCAHDLNATVTGKFSDEGISGSAGIEKRAGLLAAINALQDGDVLLVAKRDRLSRGDIMLTAMIEAAVKRKKARIVSAAGEGTDDEDPTSILMRRIIDAFAEYERLLIGQRTKAALAVKKERGERTGKVPYGWDLADDGVRLIENEDEQEVLQLIVDWNSQGDSLRRIAANLNSMQYKTKGGGPWSHSTVQRILSRESTDDSQD